MQLALAQVGSLNSAFSDDVSEYAAGHCGALEIWLTKLEQYLRTHELADVRRLLAEHGMAAPVAAQQGGLLATQGDARREAWALFERRLAILRELGTNTVVVSCDIPAPLDQATLDRSCASLAQVAATASRYEVRVALEFQARSAFGNNLRTAAALVADVGSRYLGICLDAFHYYCGPSKAEDLMLLDRDNLFHVQLCDLADIPREFAADSHRILPGEGDLDLEPILARLREIDYPGCVSIELMNPVIWQIAPRQFGEIAITALRKLLGQASMGGD